MSRHISFKIPTHLLPWVRAFSQDVGVSINEAAKLALYHTLTNAYPQLKQGAQKDGIQDHPTSGESPHDLTETGSVPSSGPALPDPENLDTNQLGFSEASSTGLPAGDGGGESSPGTGT